MARGYTAISTFDQSLVKEFRKSPGSVSKIFAKCYPIGTRFLVYAKLTDRQGGGEFVHTNHAWDVEVLVPPNE